VSADVNAVALTGRLTRDPELRATAGGTPVLGLSLAVSERARGADGAWEDRANFVDCSLFGPRAEPLSRMLAKGSQVAVSGRLRWREWRGADGGRRTALDVVCDEVVPPPRAARGPADAPAGGPAACGPCEQEDIPF
jgi:single-strand DNA-binding protein